MLAYVAPVSSAAKALGEMPDLHNLVRAGMDVDTLQQVCVKAGEAGRGDVVLATETGDLLAAADMAWTVFLDPVNGSMRQKKVWELERPWATAIDQTFLRKGRGQQVGFVKEMNGYVVTAWKYHGLPGPLLGMEDAVRLVIAVPYDAFVDDVIGPLVTVSLVTSVTPIGLLSIVTVGLLLRKCCCGDQPSPEEEGEAAKH
jgi:hypothetical protein